MAILGIGTLVVCVKSLRGTHNIGTLTELLSIWPEN